MTTPTSYWRTTVRIGSHSVYAWERLDRGGAIFLKFTDPAAASRDRRVKVKLPGAHLVRDGKGRLNPRLIRDVERAIQRYAAPLLLGVTPRSTAPDAKDLTLSEGF